MIEVRGVSKRYGAIRVIDSVSFTLGPGELVGYLGPNGSGKSTTVKMLAGLMAPTSGQILFYGSDIQDDLAGYKARVGYVPEEAHVYTYLTAAEYLRMVGRLRHLTDIALDFKIERLLRLFRLDADAHASLATFSKGMRQKVLIGAALLHNPLVLILDEVVSGLDYSTALLVRTLLKSLAARGRTIFYSSHELDTVEKISTRVIILRSGHIVADDSADRLRTLMRVPSLEDVFAQLAVADDVTRLADDVLTTIEN